MGVEVGQIRQHDTTGLRFKVLRRERKGWVVAYLPPDVPSRGKNERTYDDESIRRYYPLVEPSGDES
jgi:hypothetical protein